MACHTLLAMLIFYVKGRWQISKELPGIKYLIECGLEPITNKEKHIKELIKVAKIMGKEGIGVIENPQTDEIFLPQGVKRVLQIEKTNLIKGCKNSKKVIATKSEERTWPWWIYWTLP